MNQQNRTRLVNFLCDHRQTWDNAGTEAAVKQLDQRFPNDPLHVAALAIAAARNPQNRGPATMLAEQPEAVVWTITPTPPRHDDPPCPVRDCGSTLRDVNGECVGCKQNAAMDNPPPVRPVAAPFRDAVPAPANFRQMVEAAKEQQ